EIRFGTDGWRALIARDFTFTNVAIVAQAYSEYLIDRGDADRGVVISFDTRFMSSEFARTAAETISSNRIPVSLSRTVTPTPVLSYAVKHQQATGGVMITASHNPYQYSGIKFKDHYGGPALPALTKSVESYLGRNKPAFNPQEIAKNLSETDLFPAYEQAIHEYVRFDHISRLRGKIIIDLMHGAGIGVPERFLTGDNIELQCLHNEPDPLFGGRSPEPILKNLPELVSVLQKENILAGFATDGDADRFAVLDPKGKFVELHDLMPLLLRYLIKSRGLKGRVVRTTSMADTVDRMAEKLGGITVEEVPVGFKNIAEMMLMGDVILGGEESGGFGYYGFLPERDGILSVLLVLEMMAAENRDLDSMVAELRDSYGPFVYGRIDRHFDLAVLQKNLNGLIKNTPEKIANYHVKSVNLIDGIKIYFREGAWMLMRVSQTEPLARIYVGGSEQQMVDMILAAGEQLLTRTVGVK
ncbi:MAG: phosphoglucomutase/phosphomannomutase family protein, partial [Calditrichales bacterium]